LGDYVMRVERQTNLGIGNLASQACREAFRIFAFARLASDLLRNLDKLSNRDPSECFFSCPFQFVLFPELYCPCACRKQHARDNIPTRWVFGIQGNLGGGLGKGEFDEKGTNMSYDAVGFSVEREHKAACETLARYQVASEHVRRSFLSRHVRDPFNSGRACPYLHLMRPIHPCDIWLTKVVDHRCIYRVGIRRRCSLDNTFRE